MWHNFFKESALRPILSSSCDVSIYIYIYIYMSVPFSCNFFLGLLLALRSHDQIPASHWSTLKSCFKDFGGYLFQRFWRKIVSKILEEICFKDFGGKSIQRFWRKTVSKILEENRFKDFGGNLFQRFWRKIVSKIFKEISFEDFGRKLF